MFSGPDPATTQNDVRRPDEGGPEAARRRERLAALDRPRVVRCEADEILQELVDEVWGIFGAELCLVNLALRLRVIPRGLVG